MQLVTLHEWDPQTHGPEVTSPDAPDAAKAAEREAKKKAREKIWPMARLGLRKTCKKNIILTHIAI